MNIAELFVNLGIRGTEKAIGALGSVKKGITEISSTSLEAKAAIVGVVYGLQRLMSNSAQAGTDITNFNALTGMSTQALQQWQYAARQAGVSGEELTGSLKGVQNSMTNMLLGKGAPEGMAMLANKVGFDSKKARDTLYVMQQLQKFAQTVPPDVGNQMIKSFGVSEGTIAAMRRNAFNPEAFKAAPTYSDKEVSSLAKVDVAWSNLGNKIQMAMGHFTSKHGQKLVSDITEMTNAVIKLSEAFMKLSESMKIFQLLSASFGGWAKIFEGVNAVVSGKVSGKELGGALKNFLIEDFTGKTGGGKGFRDKEYEKKFFEEHGGGPKPAASPGANGNTEINMQLYFQDGGEDPQKTAQSVHKAVRDAYRQMQAQTQGA